MRKLTLAFIACGLLEFATGPAVPAGSLLPADKVVVRKAERQLFLMRGAEIIGKYRVVLGLSPLGPKQREGDFRTPEGVYRLERRNPNSDFFLSIQISYPNERDLAHARRQGWRPGGSVMIHGLPNQMRHPPQYYEHRDWTDGCIAVSNADMMEIWLLTAPDTPIEILP
jgi:murein L,D-transpeptidase YafK